MIPCLTQGIRVTKPEDNDDSLDESRVEYSTEVIAKLEHQSQRSFDIMHSRDEAGSVIDRPQDPNATIVMRTDERTRHPRPVQRTVVLSQLVWEIR